MIRTSLLKLIIPIGLLMICSSSYKAESSFQIDITVSNIRNTKGMMQIQLYTNQKSFAAEKPQKNYRFSKKDISGGKLHCSIVVKSKGRYGLALLDDENNNKEMDYGWLMPTEGFGFSNYYHTGWSRPEFSDFDFELNGDKKVNIKVRYL